MDFAVNLGEILGNGFFFDIYFDKFVFLLLKKIMSILHCFYWVVFHHMFLL